MKSDKKKITKTLSQEEYERRIAELQNELEELKKVKVEDNKPKKGEIWKPKKGEPFYWFDDELDANYTEMCWDFDESSINSYNYFKTKEEVVHEANVIRYTLAFKKYIEEHSEPLDWSDNSQRKYCLVYADNFIFDWNLGAKHQGAIYASSERVLKDAIEFVGKDNVIKYVLGVD